LARRVSTALRKAVNQFCMSVYPRINSSLFLGVCLAQGNTIVKTKGDESGWLRRERAPRASLCSIQRAERGKRL
jgi:hypothetical protein